jgi:solute carrier family 8 (sodium/calcium exchanger)
MGNGDFKCRYDGLLLPLFGESEMDWPNALRLILYLIGLGWTFLGVAVISDVFMAGIEKITSAKRRVVDKTTGKKKTVYVWNATVANLTLMALGSSAPEILLSLIEITSDNFFLGPLGAGTIVGSAAFNLLIISAACIVGLPDNESRYIKQIPVYIITASCSVFAYLWLMFILMFSSKDVCEIWEAVVTLLFCPLLVFVAYLADIGKFDKIMGFSEAEIAALHEDHFDQTIPEDVSTEELTEIEADIRAEHGEALSAEQVAKIMSVQYFHREKHNRAYYRHIGLEAPLHGKHVEMKTQEAKAQVQEVLNTCDDIKQETLERTVVIGFKACKYAYLENIGNNAKVGLFRMGPTDCEVSVKYETKEGTAKAGSDYDHVEEVVVFGKGETEKTVFLNIKDDDKFEKDEAFEVHLSQPKMVKGDSNYYVQLSQFNVTTVVIIDDDLPGELLFTEEEMTVVESNEASTVSAVVERINGATGTVGCQYETHNMKGVAGIDFDAVNGYLEFEPGQTTATIPVVIKPRNRPTNVDFQVVLKEPNACEFSKAKHDGCEDSCICHIVIQKADKESDKESVFTAMKERIHSANAIMGHKNWAQQFHDALFEIGDGDGDGDEEAEPPSKMDYAIHIVSVPWKLLFAFVPPVDYCGGWLCFCCALMMIAGVTAIVGDMANLVGCCLDILPETAAITFVALGTSLPDTFASMAAARIDPYADASIGNVTGSNSVNVFLGVGIAWALAAFKWETSEPTSEWVDRYFGPNSLLTASEKQNVQDASKGGNAVFVTPAGTLWFNLMIFSVNALFALQHLYARRRKWKGELGGPKKGFMGQYFSAAFLIFQWFIYVAASTIFARVNEGLTYGQIADM